MQATQLLQKFVQKEWYVEDKIWDLPTHNRNIPKPEDASPYNLPTNNTSPQIDCIMNCYVMRCNQ